MRSNRHKLYNRIWMRNFRDKQRSEQKQKEFVERMIAEGRCTKCEILLSMTVNHDCGRRWEFWKD